METLSLDENFTYIPTTIIIETNNNDKYFSLRDLEYYIKKYANEKIICRKTKKIK